MFGKLLIVWAVIFVFVEAESADACGCPDATSLAITAPGDGDKFAFSGGSPGTTDIGCVAEAYLPCNEIDIQWSCENMSGVTETFSPDAVGSTAALNLTTTGSYLPSSNTEFGNFWIHAAVDNISDTVTIKLFYSADATNSPDGSVPNWYYYYKQTIANGGTTTYDPDDTSGAGGYCEFSGGPGGQWKAFITENGHHPMDRDSWGDPAYIDRFAWTSRHEVKHVNLLSAIWGATTNRNDAEDAEGDFLKNDGEWGYHRGYNPNKVATWSDTVDYGVNPIPDPEDDCMRRTTSPYALDTLWENGTADTSDWACAGKQWY